MTRPGTWQPSQQDTSLDHLAIYLLIAGTYTPYMLVSLQKLKGPMMLADVWGIASARHIVRCVAYTSNIE